MVEFGNGKLGLGVERWLLRESVINQNTCTKVEIYIRPIFTPSMHIELVGRKYHAIH